MSNIFTSIEGACGGAKTQPDAPPVGQEAPPPYCMIPSAPSDGGATAWMTPVSPGGIGYNPRGYKLGYMDFVPKLLKKKLMGSVYEEFGALVQRANHWLEEHSGISIISCETVTWTGRNYENIYADKCYVVHGYRILRGLRLWYMTEIIPSPQRHRTAQVLTVRSYQPKSHESFTQLLRRVNEALFGENLGGKILCVETVPLYTDMSEYKPGAVNPDVTRWTGDVNKSTVALCMRVYILVGLPGESVYETIGYQDFVPEHNQRHADNKGFETCSELMDRATRWVARQQGVRFTNVQSLTVKYKKKMPFEERCVFTASESSTFLNIARVYYTTAERRVEEPPCRLTYRTFTPALTAASALSSSPEYEDTRYMGERVNQWLQMTGASLFALETVPIRRSAGNLGPEATFSKSRSEGERWLYCIRVYLNGDYVEPPAAASLVASSQSKIALSEPNLYYASH